MSGSEVQDIPTFDMVREIELKAYYERQLIRFRQMISALRYDIIKDDYPDFVRTKQWLKDNFKIEFLELF